MKKCLIYGILITFLTLLVFAAGIPVSAATYTATINVSTLQETSITQGLRGYNNHNSHVSYDASSQSFVNEVGALNLGWLRWPAGTMNDSFNWKTGLIEGDMIAQFQSRNKLYYKMYEESQISEAKGKQKLKDYYDFLSKLGLKLIIDVNGFTSTADSAGDLAKFCKDNNIIVEYWQLSNEPYLFEESEPYIYKSAADYANKMRPYNDAIKASDPNAKILVYYTNEGDNQWDIDMGNYANPYWDGITYHSYRGGSKSTSAESIRDLNSVLSVIRSDVDNKFIANSWGSVPIVVTELGPNIQADINGTLYDGIYRAECMARLSSSSNMKYLAAFRLSEGAVNAGTEYFDNLQDAWEKGNTYDISSLNFNFNNKITGLALKVVDGAINESTHRWNTTVTGGGTVQKLDLSTMPALYSQAYKGDNGKDYVTIINKSPDTHNVTIKKDGSNVTANMTVTYISGSDPLTSSAAIQSTASSNPVSVPGYCVMRVEWDRGVPQTVPTKAARITDADIGNGQVRLTWWDLDDASGYKVKYGTSPGNYSSTINVGDVNTYTVTGLTNGNTYYFAVTAYNTVGDAGISNEVAARIAVPSAPTVTSVFGRREKDLTVEWRSVPYATGYKVKYGTTPGTYTTTVDVGNMCGYVINGLNDLTTYYVAVSAYNEMGESSNSSEYNAAPNSDTPYAPNNLRITAQTATTCTLEWDPSYVKFLTDDFEDGNATGWTVASGAFSVVSHPDVNRDTKVYKSALSDSTQCQSIRGFSTWGDYDFQARIEVESWNADGVVALYGRYTDENNCYRLVYSNSGQVFKLVKKVNGVTTDLASITASELGVNTNDMTLTLSLKGNEIKALIGSREILSATDSTYSSGKLGLYSRYQNVMFDRIIVFKSNMPNGTYTVRRSTDPESGFTTIASGITGKSYNDSGLTSGTKYYYRVRSELNGLKSYGRSNTATK